MEDNQTETTTTPQVGETEGAQNQAVEGPPAWFVAYAERMDKRMEGLADKTKRLRRKDDSEGDATKPVEAPISMEDLAAAMRIGELKAGLPKGARAKVEQFAAEHGYKASLAFAEALVESIPEPPATTQTQAPRGVGASAARGTAGITSRTEYLAWRKTASPAEIDAFLRTTNLNDLKP